jgi:hypothetical protein
MVTLVFGPEFHFLALAAGAPESAILVETATSTVAVR